MPITERTKGLLHMVKENNNFCLHSMQVIDIVTEYLAELDLWNLGGERWPVIMGLGDNAVDGDAKMHAHMLAAYQQVLNSDVVMNAAEA